MKKAFAVLLFSLAAPAFCAPPQPAYHFDDPFNSTSPVMFDELNGWRLDAGEQYGAILRTSDGGKHWIDVSPPSLPVVIKKGAVDEDGFSASLSALDSKRAWVAVTVPFKKVLVDFTADGGKHWSETSLPITGADRAYIYFADGRHGFLLAVSDPASGTEHRWLYGTDDGAKRWYVLAPPGGGYPTGLLFRTPLSGWSTAVYTGADFFPLYCTRDGGKSWKEQKFPVPKEFAGGYANTEPPVFTGSDKKHGYLPVHLVNNSPEPSIEADVNYETDDGGLTWHLPASGIKIERGD